VAETLEQEAQIDPSLSKLCAPLRQMQETVEALRRVRRLSSSRLPWSPSLTVHYSKPSVPRPHCSRSAQSQVLALELPTRRCVRCRRLSKRSEGCGDRKAAHPLSAILDSLLL
jgi:hypothetical protein